MPFESCFLFLAHFASCRVAGGVATGAVGCTHPPTRTLTRTDRARAHTTLTHNYSGANFESIETRRGCRGITPRR